MAKGTATRRSSDTKRVSVAILAAARFSSPDGAGREPDLLAAAVLAALEAALEAVPAPALIAGRRGEVVCSNAAARALVGSAPDPSRWPPFANDVGSLPRRWEATPIRGVGQRAWSLLILRGSELPPRAGWNLTARQSEVLTLVSRGLTNTGIAETLGIRLGTVEFHISAIFDKVGVNSRAALIATVMGDTR
jgi:DNA-binding CsgD family transcriptional regulator